VNGLSPSDAVEVIQRRYRIEDERPMPVNGLSPSVAVEVIQRRIPLNGSPKSVRHSALIDPHGQRPALKGTRARKAKL